MQIDLQVSHCSPNPLLRFPKKPKSYIHNSQKRFICAQTEFLKRSLVFLLHGCLQYRASIIQVILWALFSSPPPDSIKCQ